MAEARRQIGFEQVGLRTAIRQNQLVVPPNQGDYAWTDDEVKQLFQDFAKAINEGTDYFLGTVVTIPRATTRWRSRTASSGSRQPPCSWPRSGTT